MAQREQPALGGDDPLMRTVGVAAAMIARADDRTPGLGVLRFEVNADRNVDLRVIPRMPQLTDKKPLPPVAHLHHGEFEKHRSV